MPKDSPYNAGLIRFELTDFSGGLNSTDSNDTLKDNESPSLKNCRSNERGDLQTRKGFSKLNTTSYGTASGIKGLFRWYKDDGTKTTLAAYDTTVRTQPDGGGASTNIATGLSSSATDYHFEAVQDSSNHVVWANGVDALRKYDGTTVSSVAPSIFASNAPKLIAWHKNKLWAVGASQPNRVYFSNTGDIDTWTSTDFIDIQPGDGDIIQRIIPFLDSLVVFKRDHVYVLQGDSLSNIVVRLRPGVVGTVAPYSVAEGVDGIYYLADGPEVRRFDGSVSELISRKIQATLDTITNPVNASGVWHDNFYRLSITTTANHDKTLLYDWVNSRRNQSESWWLDTIGFARYSVWSGSNDKGDLYGGSTSIGRIYKLEDTTADDAGAIDFEWRSKYFDGGQSEARKWIDRVLPEYLGQSGNYQMTLGLDVDFANSPTTTTTNVQLTGDLLGSTFILGTSVLASSQGLVLPAIYSPLAGQEGRYHQFRFSHNAASQPHKVLRLVWWALRGSSR